MSIYKYDKVNKVLDPIAGNPDPVVPIDNDLSTTSENPVQNKVVTNNLNAKAAKTQISNPNLLDNPFFTINQRGKTTLAEKANSSTFFVDRWIIRHCTATIVSEGISIVKDGTEASSLLNGGFVSQPFLVSYFEKLKGKTVTLSVDISDISLGSNSYIYMTAWNPSGPHYHNTAISSSYKRDLVNGINSVTFTMPTSFTYPNLQFGVGVSTSNSNAATGSYKLKAMKLEVGSVSTLAMDTAPNYELELAKCRASKADPTDTFFENAGSINVGTPNPNLLDNPFFTVNQRGITTLSATTAVPCVDRWKVRGGKIDVVADGVKLSLNSTSTAYISQYFLVADVSDWLGKTVTISADVKALSLTNASSRINIRNTTSGTNNNTTLESAVITDTGIIKITTTIPSTLSNNYLVIDVSLGVTDNTQSYVGEITIGAMKMEVGSQSTLAMDTTPNYTLELLKCQKYFERLGSSTAMMPLIGKAYTATAARFPFRFNVTKRTNPTISFSNNVAITNYGTDGLVTVSNITISWISVQSVAIDVTASGMTAGASYFLNIPTNGYIDFSADI